MSLRQWEFRVLCNSVTCPHMVKVVIDIKAQLAWLCICRCVYILRLYGWEWDVPCLTHSTYPLISHAIQAFVRCVGLWVCLEQCVLNCRLLAVTSHYIYTQSTRLLKCWRQPSQSLFPAQRLHHFPFVIREKCSHTAANEKNDNEVLVRGRPSDRDHRLLILLQHCMS